LLRKDMGRTENMSRRVGGRGRCSTPHVVREVIRVLLELT
jgi:hypothetical protein